MCHKKKQKKTSSLLMEKDDTRYPMPTDDWSNYLQQILPPQPQDF